jgi:cytochrome c5
MKQPRIMHLSASNLIIASLLILLVISNASSQSLAQRSLTGNIPFEFVLGNKTLPAGSYGFQISRNASGFLLLTISGGAAGKATMPVLTRLGGGFDPSDARLVFDVADNKHFLSEVWMPGEDGMLIQNTTKDHTHRTVLVAVTGPSTKMTGNKIYEQTCQKCHGIKGQGNPAADKFFQVAIPRLNSEVVMAKSDQELKDIITHGRRNMPPVRIGEATVQHLLSADSVDAVVSFLRTFKQ